MKKIYFLFIACLVTAITFGKDGIVYWSATEGYKFDFDLDGKIDLTLPTQTTSRSIGQIFVLDANGDGFFDLCEVSFTDPLITWIFYYNDGNNNFVDPQTIIYGVSECDKVLSGDFNGDGIGDVAIRRDNEYGLWWLISFQAMAPDVNAQFGIDNGDILLAGDLNHDGQDDIACYNKGKWIASFTPSTSEYKTPDFATKNIDNMIFGTSYDIPLLGDFDGDGYDDMGLCSINDGEISVNLHSSNKPENSGYSKNGRGSFDLVFPMPEGIQPTQVWSVPLKNVSVVKSVSGDNIKLYPNPLKRNSEFYVNVGNHNAKIVLYNSLGQIIHSIEGNNIINISTKDLLAGTYIVSILMNGDNITKKLVIY